MIAFLAGLFAGVAGGMGIGGGTILVPVLVIMLSVEQHVAQGVNLVSFLPMAVAALAVHIKKGMVDFKTAIPVMIIGLISAFAGSKLASVINSAMLRRMFGGFLLVMGLIEFFQRGGKKSKNSSQARASRHPSA